MIFFQFPLTRTFQKNPGQPQSRCRLSGDQQSCLRLPWQQYLSTLLCHIGHTYGLLVANEIKYAIATGMIFSQLPQHNIRPIHFVTLTKLIISCGQEGSHLPSELRYELSSADITMDFRPRDQLCKRAFSHMGPQTWLVPRNTSTVGTDFFHFCATHIVQEPRPRA